MIRGQKKKKRKYIKQLRNLSICKSMDDGNKENKTNIFVLFFFLSDKERKETSIRNIAK